MLKLIKTSSFVLLLGTAAFTGCKDDDACSRLTDSIAKASGGSTKEVDAWMKETMTGPNGEVPSSADRKTGCAMILGDKDALASYKEAASAAFKK